VKILSGFSRILTGIVFVFSGFVKAVDPLGSTYKFTDYFYAFNLPSLEVIALPLAMVLSAIELLVGISMLTGYRIRIGAWALTLFMAFFTILTFYLALANPVTDCGCFGDAIIMTNWQTFFKNLILLPFVTVIFLRRKKILPVYRDYQEWAYLVLFTVLIFSLQIYSLRHLPPLDFRPYNIGTYIPDKMTVPDGMQHDEYQTFLYYEKDGNVEEFTEDNFPWDDSTWTFVDTKHVLVIKGYEPPIHDFTIVDQDGFDLADMILSDQGFSMLLVSNNIAKADPEALIKANDLSLYCSSRDCSFYCLSSSSRDEVEEISASLGLAFDIYTTDEITLKTIVRSNPGLMLLKDGVVLDKWHANDLPEYQNPDEQLMANALNNQRKSKERNLIFFMSVSLLFIFLLIRYLRPVR
jgi:uncharacterized membrane protein YphA (DoxX/SURF4 family)